MKVNQFLRKTYLWILALPLALTLMGATSNQVVLYANHDTFPVSINAAKSAQLTENDSVTLKDGTVMLDDTHCIASDKTHLNLLADVLDFRTEYVSVGDLSLELGDWLWGFAPFVWGLAVVRKLNQTV